MISLLRYECPPLLVDRKVTAHWEMRNMSWSLQVLLAPCLIKNYRADLHPVYNWPLELFAEPWEPSRNVLLENLPAYCPAFWTVQLWWAHFDMLGMFGCVVSIVSSMNHRNSAHNLATLRVGTRCLYRSGPQSRLVHLQTLMGYQTNITRKILFHLCRKLPAIVWWEKVMSGF